MQGIDQNSQVLRECIAQCVSGQPLTEQLMYDAITALMTGKANEAQIAGYLIALRLKGETVEEITGAVRAMRELMVPVQLANPNEAIDIVGTGGDGANLINVSTAAAIVCAAAGIKVAKHGNRSVSSKSGSADLLEAAGVNLNITPKQVAQSVEALNVGFMFAIQHHPAMRFVGPVRKALGVRTVFNLLGPMCNPAGVKTQIIGTYDDQWCRPVVEVLQRLGAERVMSVHSYDGLDEFSLAAAAHVVELKDGKITEYRMTPEEAGLKTAEITALKVENAEHSLSVLKDAFSRKKSETGQLAADMIAYNAGAAIYMAGKADSIKQGVAIAQDILDSGLALEKLQTLAQLTQAMAINNPQS